jgi:ABC-2 type transport system ATP-binding protein/teichoic acid transport system ATP-binding protein
VSFAVPKGSVLAVIGRNGAGKSTLLRIIAGILAPTEGRVTVRGRISTLLSMGVGFKPEMTGRENIRLGGLAVGLTEERLEYLTDSIAEFAQLGEYIDFPVNGYSSGMKSRLAFAVAAHLDPEVLLIDEALAGGDSKFKERTGQKMHELCGNGRTIVLVTHGLSTVKLMATTALWLHQGKVVEFGDPEDVVASYMRYCRIEALEGIDDE